MKNVWDVIVVGAGAAGLFAAATAAARGRSTLLVEKNRKLGVKILMSGGTRCNITQNTTWQGIADAFGSRQGRFLKFALASLPPENVVDFFHSRNVPTKVEPAAGGGKVFPCSDRAIDVRDALVSCARDAGVTIANETAVKQIQPSGHGLTIDAGSESFHCESLVLTCGGQSYPGCGTTGDGYAWLKQLGHSIATPRPALTPIRVVEPWVRDLSGVTIPDMELNLQVVEENRPGKRSDTRTRCRGSFLFTHKGCSGPTVLNVSRAVTDPANPFKKKLVCDWLPDTSEELLRRELGSSALRRSGKQLGNHLSQNIPRRLVTALCNQAGISIEQSMAEISKKQLALIVAQIKYSSLSVDGTLGFARAEVTAGGVELGEVNMQTMASKIVPGLYLAGEILDVDGPIGGYNFQAAFSTGFVAGENA